MSESAILWIFGILVTINSGIVGVLFLMLWGHIRDCRKSGDERAGMLATLQAQQNTILREIGDHETGLRGSLHQLRNEVFQSIIRADAERERK